VLGLALFPLSDQDGANESVWWVPIYTATSTEGVWMEEKMDPIMGRPPPHTTFITSFPLPSICLPPSSYALPTPVIFANWMMH
jgi:hypothetical protein